MASFDISILHFFHTIALATNGMATYVADAISFFCNHSGLPIILISLALCIPKKTRKYGVGMIIAMAMGAILTNLLIKPVVARPRPYQSGDPDLLAWWQYAGSHMEKEYSFPSGHTTAMMAAMSAIYILGSFKHKYLVYIPVILMGMSRNYLMVHYPTDVLGGVVIGLIGALLMYSIMKRLESTQLYKTYIE